jgi:hypothetical protein
VAPANALLELDESEIEPLVLDGLEVARIRLTGGPPPYSAATLGGREYRYERSFPVKGYGAALPTFLRERLAEGKTPLLIERPDRFYVYLS